MTGDKGCWKCFSLLGGVRRPSPLTVQVEQKAVRQGDAGRPTTLFVFRNVRVSRGYSCRDSAQQHVLHADVNLKEPRLTFTTNRVQTHETNTYSIVHGVLHVIHTVSFTSQLNFLSGGFSFVAVKLFHNQREKLVI